MCVDPLADQFPGWNPYNYTLNNPVNMIDPDGRAPMQGGPFNPIYTATGPTATISAKRIARRYGDLGLSVNQLRANQTTKWYQDFRKSTAAPLAGVFGGLTATLMAPLTVAGLGEGAAFARSSYISACEYSPKFHAFMTSEFTSFSSGGMAVDFISQSVFNLAEGKNIGSNYNVISGGVSAFTGPFVSAFVGTKYSYTYQNKWETKKSGTAIATGIVGGSLGKLAGNFSDYLGNNFKISGIDGYSQSFELTNPIAKMIGFSTEAGADIPSKIIEKTSNEK